MRSVMLCIGRGATFHWQKSHFQSTNFKFLCQTLLNEIDMIVSHPSSAICKRSPDQEELSPPRKKPKLLCDSAPISPWDGFNLGIQPTYHVNESPQANQYPSDIPIPVAIKWNQHPESPPLTSYDNKSINIISSNHNDVLSPSVTLKKFPETPICSKPLSTTLASILNSADDLDTTHAEEILKPFPTPFPELNMDTVMSILNYCNNPIGEYNHSDTPSIQIDIPSLQIEGPYFNEWFVGGINSYTTLEQIRTCTESLLSKCRRDSDINTRFSLIFEDKYRSHIGDNIKGRLWDVTPSKLADDIYHQMSNFSMYLESEMVHLKMSLFLQESTVKLMSDNDVKKKRSVITIYEDDGASLIYAFYVAVQRNGIVSQKKATKDAKRKKELENQLTNVYRKGRKSLRKKTQVLLDRSRVNKSIDDLWGFGDIVLLEMKLGVRCVVFSAMGKCMYEGPYEYQHNEIDLLYINNRFHVLASRNVFRNYPVSSNKF